MEGQKNNALEGLTWKLDKSSIERRSVSGRSRLIAWLNAEKGGQNC